MEVLEAVVTEKEDKFFIEINKQNEKIIIPLSDDNPNEIKKAFNKLIIHLKNGEYKVKLQDEKSSLPSLVAKEYIEQLNNELKDVYGELQYYKLIKE